MPGPIRKVVLHRDMLCATTSGSNVFVLSLITKTLVCVIKYSGIFFTDFMIIFDRVEYRISFMDRN